MLHSKTVFKDRKTINYPHLSLTILILTPVGLWHSIRVTEMHFRVKRTGSEVIQPQLQTIPVRNLVDRKFSKFIRVSSSILSPLNNLGRMEADKPEEFIHSCSVELTEASAAYDNLFSHSTQQILFAICGVKYPQQLLHARCTSAYKRKKLCNSYLELF